VCRAMLLLLLLLLHSVLTGVPLGIRLKIPMPPPLRPPAAATAASAVRSSHHNVVQHAAALIPRRPIAGRWAAAVRAVAVAARRPRRAALGGPSFGQRGVAVCRAPIRCFVIVDVLTHAALGTPPGVRRVQGPTRGVHAA
jgi:hypothetical protein